MCPVLQTAKSEIWDCLVGGGCPTNFVQPKILECIFLLEFHLQKAMRDSMRCDVIISHSHVILYSYSSGLVDSERVRLFLTRYCGLRMNPALSSAVEF